MVHPPSRAIELIILSISLSITLSPGDVWLFLNTQNFLISHHTKILLYPSKLINFHAETKSNKWLP